MHPEAAAPASASSPSWARYEVQDQMIQQDAYGLGRSVVDVEMGLGVGVENELWGAIGFVPGEWERMLCRIVGRPRLGAEAEHSKKADFYFFFPVQYTCHLSLILYYIRTKCIIQCVGYNRRLWVSLESLQRRSSSFGGFAALVYAGQGPGPGFQSLGL